MKANEIITGEKYFFVATDSVTRKHLEGTEFLVVEKRRVWRRVKGKRANVYRFFNEWGEGARAEELEPINEVVEKSVISENLRVFGMWGEWHVGHPANIQPGDYKDEDQLPF